MYLKNFLSLILFLYLISSIFGGGSTYTYTNGPWSYEFFRTDSAKLELDSTLSQGGPFSGSGFADYGPLTDGSPGRIFLYHQNDENFIFQKQGYDFVGGTGNFGPLTFTPYGTKEIPGGICRINSINQIGTDTYRIDSTLDVLRAGSNAMSNTDVIEELLKKYYYMKADVKAELYKDGSPTGIIIFPNEVVPSRATYENFIEVAPFSYNKDITFTFPPVTFEDNGIGDFFWRISALPIDGKCNGAVSIDSTPATIDTTTISIEEPPDPLDAPFTLVYDRDTENVNVIQDLKLAIESGQKFKSKQTGTPSNTFELEPFELYQVRVKPGVVISSDSTDEPSMRILGAPELNIEIQNDGVIVGRGGDGGDAATIGGATGVDGENGGPAIETNLQLNIINNDLIAAGGGGGAASNENGGGGGAGFGVGGDGNPVGTNACDVNKWNAEDGKARKEGRDGVNCNFGDPIYTDTTLFRIKDANTFRTGTFTAIPSGFSLGRPLGIVPPPGSGDFQIFECPTADGKFKLSQDSSCEGVGAPLETIDVFSTSSSDRVPLFVCRSNNNRYYTTNYDDCELTDNNDVLEPFSPMYILRAPGNFKNGGRGGDLGERGQNTFDPVGNQIGKGGFAGFAFLLRDDAEIFLSGNPVEGPQIDVGQNIVIVGDLIQYDDNDTTRNKIRRNILTNETSFIDAEGNEINISLPEIITPKEIRVVKNGVNIRNETIDPVKIALAGHKIKKYRNKEDAESFINETVRLMEKLDITKNLVFNNITNKTNVTISINNIPESERQNLTIYQVIPKDIAASIDDINFISDGGGQRIIIDKDPVIGWYFNESGGDEDIEYEADGEGEGGDIIITQEPILYNEGELIINYREGSCNAGELALFEIEDLEDSRIFQVGTGELYTVCISHIDSEVLINGKSGEVDQYIFNYTNSGSVSIWNGTNNDLELWVSYDNTSAEFWDVQIQDTNPSGNYSCIGSVLNTNDSLFGDCGYSQNRIWIHLGADTLPPTTQAIQPYVAHTIRVEMDAQDNIGGSGIDSTYFCIDESNTCIPLTTYTEPIGVTCQYDWGCIKYTRYYSVDMEGNIENVKSTELRLIDKGSACQADCTARPSPNRYLKECRNLNGCKYYDHNGDDGLAAANACDFLTEDSYGRFNESHDIYCPAGPFRKSIFSAEEVNLDESWCTDIISVPFVAIIDGESVLLKYISCLGDGDLDEKSLFG